MARPTNPLESFFWGEGGQPMTEEEIARQRQIAEALMAGGIDTSPVGHWTQGAARLAQAFAGRVKEGRADRAASGNADYNKSIVESLFGGMGQPATTAPAQDIVSSAAPTPQTSALMRGTGEIPAAPAAPAISASAPVSGDWLNYANQGATRSQPLNEKLTQALSFLPDLGVSVEVFSGGQPGKGEGGARTGSTRHDHGNAADVFFVKDGRKLNWANEADRPIFEEIVRRGKQAGITGFGAGPGYMREGSMHIGFGSPSVWGAGGKGANAPDWLRAAYNGAPSAAVPQQAAAQPPAPQQVASLDQSIGMPPQPGPTDADLMSLPVGGSIQMPQMAPVPMARPEPQMAPDEQRVVAQLLSQGSMGGPQQGFAMPQGMQQPAQAPPPVAQQQQAAPGINPAIIQALSDPRVDANTKRIAGMLLQQNMAQQQAAQQAQMEANDPMNRLALEKAQLEIEAMRNPQAKVDGVTVGNRVIDRNTGKVIYEGQPEESAGFRPATPEEAQKFGAAAGQFGPDNRFYPLNPPQGTSLSVDPATGAVSFNQGAGVKPLTEAQSKDTVFATRATNALPIVNQYEKSLLSLSGSLAEGIPMNLGNYAQSEEYQLARDAGRDFLATILRKDSGAAITPNEESIYGKMFLPQPGDKPATITAKRQRRALAVEAIKAGMPASAIENMSKALDTVPTEIDGYKIEQVD